jgi:5'-deoxynucleotidase YfbR-like HD superfamily hydrolase
MLLADIETQGGRRVKVERVLRLAILHDLAESLTFDISKSYLEYLGEEGETIKSELERAAWGHIMKDVPSMGVDYADLQSEFNAEGTLESQIVHAADMLDILFQIVEYHRRGYPKALLGDLWASTNGRLMRFRLPSVRGLRRIAVRGYRAATSRL